MLEACKAYAHEYYGKHIDPDRFNYHCWAHIESVVEAVEKIGQGESRSQSEIQLLKIAAYFHDIGIYEDYQNHELAGSKIARQFLESQHYPEQDLAQVERLILATKADHHPTDQLEEIIKDADLNNLGSDHYMDVVYNLKKEQQNLGVWAFESDKTYFDFAVEFISNHTYYTPTAQKAFDQKKSNIKKIKKIRKDLKMAKKPKEITKLDDTKTGQMILKTALRNHIDLSSLADSKASTMLSINSLIITVAIPLMIPRITENSYLAIPTVILLLFCVASILFATLVTKPIKMKGYTSEEDIKAGKGDLFFFGNFFNLDFETYKKGLEMTIFNAEHLEESIYRDLFYSGKALGGKFNQLRLCYLLFIVGIIASVIAFILVMIFLNGNSM